MNSSSLEQVSLTATTSIEVCTMGTFETTLAIRNLDTVRLGAVTLFDSYDNIIQGIYEISDIKELVSDISYRILSYPDVTKVRLTYYARDLGYATHITMDCGTVMSLMCSNIPNITYVTIDVSDITRNSSATPQHSPAMVAEAIKSNELKRVKKYLDDGFDFNVFREISPLATVLHSLDVDRHIKPNVQLQQIEIMNIILASPKIKVDVLDATGLTPLAIAALKLNTSAVKILLNAKANVNRQLGLYGKNELLFHRIWSVEYDFFRKGTMTELLRILIESGMKEQIFETNHLGQTPRLACEITKWNRDFIPFITSIENETMTKMMEEILSLLSVKSLAYLILQYVTSTTFVYHT